MYIVIDESGDVKVFENVDSTIKYILSVSGRIAVYYTRGFAIYLARFHYVNENIGYLTDTYGNLLEN